MARVIHINTKIFESKGIYPNAAQLETWTEWTIDLQEFADQGVNLANVNTIAIGLGNKKNPVAGGSGTIYIDDIRLYRPAEPAP